MFDFFGFFGPIGEVYLPRGTLFIFWPLTPGPSSSLVPLSLSSFLPHRHPSPPSAATVTSMLYGTMDPDKGRFMLSTTPRRASSFGFLGRGYQIQYDPMEGYHGSSQVKRMEGPQKIVAVCFFRCHGTNFGGCPATTTTQQT